MSNYYYGMGFAYTYQDLTGHGPLENEMGIHGLKANWYHWSMEVSRLAGSTEFVSCLRGSYRWACIQSDRNWESLCDYYGE